MYNSLIEFVILEKMKAYLRCQRTKKTLYCDGSHAR